VAANTNAPTGNTPYHRCYLSFVLLRPPLLHFLDKWVSAFHHKFSVEMLSKKKIEDVRAGLFKSLKWQQPLGSHNTLALVVHVCAFLVWKRAHFWLSDLVVVPHFSNFQRGCSVARRRVCGICKVTPHRPHRSSVANHQLST
jgi:hypothetical protein